MSELGHVVGFQSQQIIKRAKSLICLPEDRIQARPLISLLEACRTHYTTDAHFTTYFMTDKSDSPALAKHVLTEIRKKNFDLLTEVLALDVDIKEHKEWTSDLFKIFEQQYEKICKELPQPTIVYTTKHGIRFVFALNQPLPVDEAERYHRALSNMYAEYLTEGLEVDLKCHNWDRCFRLPHVVRDGKKSWEESSFLYVEQLEHILDISKIKPEGPLQSNPVSGEELDFPKPTLDECYEMLFTDKGRKTDWLKFAKKVLKGRDCFPAIFEDQPIAEVGHRNSTIQAFAGQVCALLTPFKDSSPPNIYALLFNSVVQLEPDEDTPDWTDILWQAVLKYYAKEEEILRQKGKEKEKKEVKKLDKLDNIIEVMQTWSNNKYLHSSNKDTRRAFAISNLIVMTPTEYFVMTERGYYHPIGTTKLNEIPALVRRYKMDDIINLIRVSKNGTEDLLSGPVILARHGVKVKEMFGRINAKGLHVEYLGTDQMQLITNLFSLRKDLLETARFHPEVDKWLHTFVAPEDYDTFEAWIAWALAFDEGPVCALSLAGPPGCGKKLFCQGLAECLTSGEYATSREFGRFRETLLRTCFLVIDEGLPKPQQGVPDVADTFRHFVSGDPLQVEQKYKTPITIYNPLRIVFTSNNADVIQQLAGHRELTLQDQEALAMRILHLETQQDATTYLLSLGGAHGTKGWIAADAGGESDYVVARHLLWIYLHKRKEHPRQRRFLVEGSLDSEVMTEMKLRSGISPQVVESIIDIIEGEAHQASKGISIDKGKGEVWVTNKGVADRFKLLFPTQRLNGHALRKVLNNITKKQYKGRKTQLTGAKSESLIWRGLDLELLLEEAVKNGISYKNLEKLYTKKLQIDNGEDLLSE